MKPVALKNHNNLRQPLNWASLSNIGLKIPQMFYPGFLPDSTQDTSHINWFNPHFHQGKHIEMLLLIILTNVGKTTCSQQNQVKTWAELPRKFFTSIQTKGSGLRANTTFFRLGAQSASLSLSLERFHFRSNVFTIHLSLERVYFSNMKIRNKKISCTFSGGV